MTIKPKIGDQIIDDCGHIGTIDALPGDQILIDDQNHWEIPPRNVGIRHIDQSFHIIKIKNLKMR